MRFLPVVERELRAASRRFGTYWVRSFVALIVIVVSAWIVLVNHDEQPREVAEILYYTITGGALLYCTLIGIRVTADCISEEKREGTLGLLFLTDLKGYDVVLGKLVANSLNGFYGLAAVFPIVAVVLMMGGITMAQVAKTSAVLLNTMFMSVCLAIFASACSRSGKRAVTFALFLVMLFTGIIPGLAAWVAWRLDLGNFQNWEFAMWTTPAYAYFAAQDFAARVTMPMSFAWSLATIHAIAWTFLLLACLVAPRSWQDNPAGARKVRLRERWKTLSHGAAESRVAFRRRLLDANAFFWLAARERLKPTWVWTFLGICGCTWVWGLMRFEREWLNAGIYITTAFTLNSVLKNWFAQEASRQLSEERHAGSLELLLSTSLTVPEILRGQAMALRRQFFGPLVIVLLSEFLMLEAGANEMHESDEKAAWISVWVVGMLVLVADIIALYWVGMWMGLASKNPKRAYSDTVGRVLAIPWIVFAGFVLFCVLISISQHASPTWQLFVGMWLTISLVTDLGFGLWARQRLLEDFRTAAARRFQRRVPLWRRVLGLETGSENSPTAFE